METNQDAQYPTEKSAEDQSIVDLTGDLFAKMDTYQPDYTVKDIGFVEEVGDGIARVSGLHTIGNQELVEFDNGAIGIAFSLELKTVGVIVLGDYFSIKEGSIVRKLGRIASVPVGKEFLGRVVNPLGEPLDGKGPINHEEFRPIERIAPGIHERSDVDTPLQTGIKAIDTMIPIGRGQRELIIGDRQTGRPQSQLIRSSINAAKTFSAFMSLSDKKNRRLRKSSLSLKRWIR